MYSVFFSESGSLSSKHIPGMGLSNDEEKKPEGKIILMTRHPVKDILILKRPCIVQNWKYVD